MSSDAQGAPFRVRQDLYEIPAISFQPSAAERIAFQKRLSGRSPRALSPHFESTGTIFPAVPRTASTAVSRALYGEHVGHYWVADYLAGFREADRDSARCFWFAFVRHPLDRLISAYHYLRRGGSGNDYDRWARERLEPYSNLDDFARRGLGRLSEEVMHFMPQWRQLADPEGRLAVNFIGRFERLAEDFKRLCGVTGRTAALPSPAPRPPLETEARLGEEARACVIRVYAADFRLVKAVAEQR